MTASKTALNLKVRTNTPQEGAQGARGVDGAVSGGECIEVVLAEGFLFDTHFCETAGVNEAETQIGAKRK